MAKWRKSNPNYPKDYRKTEAGRLTTRRGFLKKYGITPEEWDRIYQEQNGLCAACRERPIRDTDHNHVTKAFRGLLCPGCNLAEGMMEGNPEWIRRLADYLEVENQLGSDFKFTPKRIEELTREQINNLVNVSDVESGKKRTEAVAKARVAAYQGSHKGTATADNAAVNAVLRAIRRDGPMETYKVAAAMAAVESATYAEIASDALTDAEYTILVRPLARAIGEPEKRPQAAQQGGDEMPLKSPIPAEAVGPRYEPSEDEIEAFFGSIPTPQHEWEQAIKGAPEQYPVPYHEDKPKPEDKIKQLAAQFNELPVVVGAETGGLPGDKYEDEELDLFS